MGLGAFVYLLAGAWQSQVVAWPGLRAEFPGVLKAVAGRDALRDPEFITVRKSHLTYGHLEIDALGGRLVNGATWDPVKMGKVYAGYVGLSHGWKARKVMSGPAPREGKAASLLVDAIAKDGDYAIEVLTFRINDDAWVLRLVFPASDRKILPTVARINRSLP